jgi:hypothetical protein
MRGFSVSFGRRAAVAVTGRFRDAPPSRARRAKKALGAKATAEVRDRDIANGVGEADRTGDGATRETSFLSFAF